MIGRMQSIWMPLPAFAPPRSNPACWKAAMICPHAPASRRLRVGDACSEDSHGANQAYSQWVLPHARYSPFRPASS
jgi:hypothetical protein